MRIGTAQPFRHAFAGCSRRFRRRPNPQVAVAARRRQLLPTGAQCHARHRVLVLQLVHEPLSIVFGTVAVDHRKECSLQLRVGTRSCCYVSVVLVPCAAVQT